MGAARDPPFAPARVFPKLIFYYMIFDVSDAEAKRVAAGHHHRRDDGLRNAVSRP
jgi:hypothetical protein